MISLRTFSFAKDNFCFGSTFVGKKLLLNNFSFSDGFFLISVTNLNEHSEVSLVCYFLTSPNYTVAHVGCNPLEKGTKKLL